MYKILKAISGLLKKLQNKMYTKKEARFAARNRSRVRKNVLQNVQDSVSAKQQNLEELVLDLEQEDIAKQEAKGDVSHHDVAAWVSAVKNQENDKVRFQEMLDARQNQLLADKYFEKQKLKNLKDAQFLRAKTFWNANPHKTTGKDTLELQELYEETKNLRRVVEVYNRQKTK